MDKTKYNESLRSEMRPVGCSGQRGCPAPVPRVRVERVEGGLLVAGVQIASTCQVALPVSAIIFLVIGSIITVIAYQGQTPEEDHEAYVLRVSNSTNSRVLGPVCLAIALLMMLAGILVCLLVKYAHSKEQKVCFHCPIHGDFFPIIPVPVSAVTRHRSRLFRRQSSPGAPPEPPQCPYSNLLSARNSVSSGGSCPVPKPFVINNSLKCVEYFWPLTVTHDIASFPASRTPSPTPINTITDSEIRDSKPMLSTALPEVTLVAPATVTQPQVEH
ncbi:uncharacterized protein LOC124369955 [Homalodisca vitripennis]|uniref:uncharacterized protein LOC124369955 n=1 Tax=Homalodisca vitripennis TaxID=197043 RepID=UPI001EEB8B7D|nr:uncharacterized protein LOC124369955 [Homalodisca vitripennis]